MTNLHASHPLVELACYRELTPAQRQAVHAHLAVCGECRAQFEAFQRQDALLATAPQIAPRRQRWGGVQKNRLTVRAGLARLGDVMAVGGLATATIAAVLIVQAMATAPVQTGSAPLVPGLPLVVPPDLPARVSPWLLAAPWLGGASSLIGLLLALGQRWRVWTWVGLALTVFLLFSYIPPLTLVPNPLGLFWRVVGGYGYDPNLPFKNLFVVSGDPTAKLRPHLDRLIGQTGLDPLDPAQPLTDFAFEWVRVPRDWQMALVTTRFTFADGSNRVYNVPLFDPLPSGFYMRGWQNDGLARLRTEHLALPGQPFATQASPVRLGEAVRLALSPQAEQLDAVNPYHWTWLGNRLQRLVWSPQGDAFLLVEWQNSAYQLWLISLDGAAPRLVTRGAVHEYGWSPDGRFIVYTAPDEMRVSSGGGIEVVQLVVARRDTLEKTLAPKMLANMALPSLTGQGLWYAQDGALWLMDYESGESIRVTDLLGSGRPSSSLIVSWPLAVSPDGSRVAYACGSNLCLMNTDGGNRQTISAAGIRSIAWDAGGARLAAVSLDSNNFGPVRLLIVSREGDLRRDVAIAPRDAADPPQWTPDGQWVFVQTFPMGGRRIIAVEAAAGQALDLSREHWDAYFALSPDGQSLLLNNGRGGFWLAPVIK